MSYVVSNVLCWYDILVVSMPPRRCLRMKILTVTRLSLDFLVAIEEASFAMPLQDFSHIETLEGI